MEYKIEKKSSFKSLLNIDNDSTENVEKLRLILLALFGAALPFDIFYTTLIIFLLVVTMLIDFSVKKISTIPKVFWVFSGAILLSGIGYFYSTDTWRASYLIERQLAIFIFAVLIPLVVKIDRVKLNFILWFFTMSCILTSLYLFSNCLFVIIEFNLPLKYLFTASFFNHNFSAPIGIHASYLSLYLLISIIFMIDKFLISNLKSRITAILSLIILLAALFFLSSRTTIISLIIIIVLIYPIYHIKNKFNYFVAIFLILIISLVIGSQSEYVKKRFSSELAGDLILNKKYTVNDPEPRILRWKCALEIIEKKPIFGHGTGEEIGLLKEKYLERKMILSYKEAFNTHNQYLAILIKNGFFGLIIFLAMMTYFFRLAIKAGDFIYLSFMILLSIGFFTENIIDANKGIFFFAFFNTLFGYTILNERKKRKEQLHTSTI